MMHVEEYIARLLFNNDCVIVPGLGAFIANPVEARYEPFQEKFFPPGKRISFNVKLNHNDGLLAGSISRWLDISYDEAIKQVRTWVHHIQKQLQNGNSVELGEIGLLRLNENQMMVFQPSYATNFSKKAFGLTPISALPIVRQEKTSALAEDEIIEQTVEPVRRPKVIPMYAKVAAAAAVTLLALWIPFRSDLNQLKLHQSGLDIFKSPTAFYSKLSYDKKAETLKENKTLLLKEIDTSGVILWDFENSDFGPDDFTIPVRFSEEIRNQMSARRTGQYHLIVGCFREINNANRLVKKLRKMGTEASIIGKRHGLNIVSYGAYHTTDEARKHLFWVKQNIQDEAWILKY